MLQPRSHELGTKVKVFWEEGRATIPPSLAVFEQGNKCFVGETEIAILLSLSFPRSYGI